MVASVIVTLNHKPWVGVRERGSRSGREGGMGRPSLHRKTCPGALAARCWRAALVLAWLPGPAAAFESQGLLSRELPPDARSEGMGAGFTAVAEEASAAFWNPGALVFGDELSLIPLSYMELY